MSEECLPVYDIQDFEPNRQQEPVFYINRFESHLASHPIVRKPHKHNFYLIILITAGSGTHTIDFETYEVKPQTVFFLSPGQVHSWELAEDVAGFILFFSLDFYLLGFPQKKLLSFPFFDTQLHKPFLLIPADPAQPIGQLFNSLLLENENQDWNRDDMIRNYIDILLIKLARIFFKVNAKVEASPVNFSDLQKLENLIDTHYKNHETVPFYASQMHLTEKQLNNLVKLAHGKSVTELIQNRIILEARRLLIHTDFSITRIAAELGYFDNSYFARFFKKRTGQTPEQFRLSH
jgi:AraC family transcriptional regulator, transcriptional activator of pobA